ncbi:hypothetical protein C7476_1095 [Phyllobacterium bourgognense]|uniref:Uncharacterized protein n=1 Tax=Phyllobacterium bourgognense TaxID=314236 RepID=A0A368YUH4_9HYPH|nr:hypothetical protein C7476_1095 [Phyllobacterium bourgognense]
MRIDDDDFSSLRLADAVVAAQAQHVLGVSVTGAVARNRLHGEEREPSFPANTRNIVEGCIPPENTAPIPKRTKPSNIPVQCKAPFARPKVDRGTLD